MASLGKDAVEVVRYFTFLDYTVFALMLLMSAGVGIYHSYEQKTAKDLLMGNRSMGVIPVAISIVVSFLSSISLLGLPSESYRYGTQLFVASIITQPLSVLIAGNFFVPVFYNLGVTSSYQYLELRFGRLLRTLCSIMYCVTNLFYMGIALYGPALALSQVTGMDKWWAVIATGVVCTFYTTIGGMKAVVWTDVFQSVILMSALISILVWGAFAEGGFVRVWSDNYSTGRIEAFNLDPGPYVRHTFTTVFIGTLLGHTSHYGINQSLIQRYLSLPSLKDARRSLWTVLPIKFIVYGIIAAAGLVVAAKYLYCDPLSTNRIQAMDQIFPLFVMDMLGNFPGVPGLFVAGIFSGSLSVLSAGINSMTAVVLEDIIKVHFHTNLSEKESTKLLKTLAVIFGIFALGGAVVASNLGNIIQASNTVFSLLSSPIVGIFFLGLFFPMANAKGAIFGASCGFLVNLWLGLGTIIYRPKYPGKVLSAVNCVGLYEKVNKCTYNETIFRMNELETLDNLYKIPAMYRISYMYYSCIGVSLTVIFGLFCSYYYGNEKEEEKNADLFVPFVRRRLLGRKKFTSVQYAPLDVDS